ncbi:MAG TPA: hypothetical protein VK249_24650 [Anaerolineales bacterium]|nr:hypothetical protein [Anaerolineales bacterium]
MAVVKMTAYYDMKIQTRFIPFVAISIFALIFALWAGLLRLGWTLPTFPNLSSAHGPLMIAGFLGTLIPLERAVAIRQRWMFAVPIVTGLGWVACLFSTFAGAALITLGSLGTLAILGTMVRREPYMHTVTMALGALCWVVGNVLWLIGFPIFRVIFLWMTFLILTIGGERLELSRVLQPTATQRQIFIGITIALLSGAILSLFTLTWGARLSGLSMLVLALWFLENDLARRNIRHKNPLTRYIAICLFSGFIWLGAGGILNLGLGASYAGPLYDAALHTVFVGFVISMIFGHAPIIFPAILGAPIKYYPVFYGHLFLLHLSLILRVAGDLAIQMEIRRWGGLLNEVAILLFLGMTVYSILRGE